MVSVLILFDALFFIYTTKAVLLLKRSIMRGAAQEIGLKYWRA